MGNSLPESTRHLYSPSDSTQWYICELCRIHNNLVFSAFQTFLWVWVNNIHVIRLTVHTPQRLCHKTDLFQQVSISDTTGLCSRTTHALVSAGAQYYWSYSPLGSLFSGEMVRNTTNIYVAC